MRGLRQYGPPDKYDRPQREMAATLTRRTSNWVVVWGAWSRAYWGFPRFAAPPGTVLSAEHPDEVLAKMHRAEVAAHASQTMIPARPQQPGHARQGQP